MHSETGTALAPKREVRSGGWFIVLCLFFGPASESFAQSFCSPERPELKSANQILPKLHNERHSPARRSTSKLKSKKKKRSKARIKIKFPKLFKRPRKDRVGTFAMVGGTADTSAPPSTVTFASANLYNRGVKPNMNRYSVTFHQEVSLPAHSENSVALFARANHRHAVMAKRRSGVGPFGANEGLGITLDPEVYEGVKDYGVYHYKRNGFLDAQRSVLWTLARRRDGTTDLLFSVHMAFRKKQHIGARYRQAKETMTLADSLTRSLRPDRVIIGGDFNVNFLSPERDERTVDYLLNYKLRQRTPIPLTDKTATMDSGRKLDEILLWDLRAPEHVAQTQYTRRGSEYSSASDHRIVSGATEERDVLIFTGP